MARAGGGSVGVEDKWTGGSRLKALRLHRLRLISSVRPSAQPQKILSLEMGTGSARLTELADVQALERRFKVASMSEIIFQRDNVRLRTAEDIDNLQQRPV